MNVFSTYSGREVAGKLNELHEYASTRSILLARGDAAIDAKEAWKGKAHLIRVPISDAAKLCRSIAEEIENILYEMESGVKENHTKRLISLGKAAFAQEIEIGRAKHQEMQYLPDDAPEAEQILALYAEARQTMIDMSQLAELGDRLHFFVDSSIKAAPSSEPKRKSASQLCYRNLITDTESKMIWRKGAKENGQRFQNNSYIYHLWLLLLENIGISQEKRHIIGELRKRTHREDERLDADINKGLENLQRKLKDVSHEDWPTVRSWFEETSETVLLKNLD